MAMSMWLKDTEKTMQTVQRAFDEKWRTLESISSQQQLTSDRE